MDSKEFKLRLEKIFVNAEKVDKILIVNTDTADPNFFYVTGFTSGVFESTYLVLEKDHATLLTSQLEYTTAKEQAFEGLEVVKIEDIKHFREALGKLLNGHIV